MTGCKISESASGGFRPGQGGGECLIQKGMSTGGVISNRVFFFTNEALDTFSVLYVFVFEKGFNG